MTSGLKWRFLFIRFLATAQIVGASSAAVAILPAFAATTTAILDLPIFDLPIFALMLGILATGFVSGIWLWNGEKRGYRVSAIVHLMQVPVVSSVALTYKFVFGFGVTVILVGDGNPLLFDIGGKSFLIVVNDAAEFFVGFNVWAAVMCVLLWRRGSLLGSAPVAPSQ